MEIEWASALKEAREARNEFTHSESKELDISTDGQTLKSRFSAVAEQLWRYTSSIQKKEKKSKELIISTRSALRYGLCCISFENESVRTMFQDHAVLNCQWHIPLCTLLSLPGDDGKCQLLAGQLLSNLVTCNPNTASLLSLELSISPSNDWISANIMETNFAERNLQDENEKEYTMRSMEGPNWVDMFLSCIKSGNRDVAAVVAAALHNCIVSLGVDSSCFCQKVVSDPILISTILRNFISATQKPAVNEEQSKSEWDGATEWFYLLLTRLIRLGVLGLMYTGISGPEKRLEGIQIVLPEQNVLLHCMTKYADEESQNDDFISSTNDGEKDDSVRWKETFGFLAQLFGRLLHIQNKTLDEDVDTALLLDSAIISILEILSTILGNTDSQRMKMLRDYLGTTRLIPDIGKALGKLVDDVTERNSGLKAREMKMSQAEQQLITLMVSLLGNLCYSCPQNQDLMRTTIVPSLGGQPTDAESSSMSEERSALHVILSCTSLATCCFTLREWSVIAIRNMLHENSKNQELVADLNAQSPVQTAALASAGVQVQLDHATGKVSLSPLKEGDEEGANES